MKKLIIGLALVVLLLVPAACAGEQGGGAHRTGSRLSRPDQ